MVQFPKTVITSFSLGHRAVFLPRRALSTSLKANQREKTIAFVGLGAMGREMANNLFSKTLMEDSATSFVICDALPESAATFARNFVEKHPGVTINVVDTPGQAATQSSVIVTMLPSSPQVNQVYLGTGGILEQLTSLRAESGRIQMLAIDSTTLDVAAAKSVAATMASNGIEMVDAPVSGGVVGAAAGTLSFMVGGPEVTFEQARPFLEKMGKTITHCGASGNGLVVKICNNLILAINQIAIAEGMLLGTTLGLPPALLASVINNSTGRSWPSSVNNPVLGALPGQSPPCERDYNGGFASKLMLKDLELALNAAKSVSVPLPMGRDARDLYHATASDKDLESRDFSVVYKHLLKLRNDGLSGEGAANKV